MKKTYATEELTKKDIAAWFMREVPEMPMEAPYFYIGFDDYDTDIEGNAALVLVTFGERGSTSDHEANEQGKKAMDVGADLDYVVDVFHREVKLECYRKYFEDMTLLEDIQNAGV